MKKILSKFSLFLILQQLLNTLRQSLSMAFINGNFLGSYYWFLVRNYVSIFGNLAGSAKTKNTNLTFKLREDWFMELSKLSENGVASLIDFFLESQQEEYFSLQDYFDKQRVKNIVRSEEVDIFSNDDLRKSILSELNLLPIVSEFLGLPQNEILALGKIDALFKIKGERKLRKNYDDALEFHRDADSLRFVKVFIYLVDVNEGFGEHQIFVRSNKSLPWNLRTIGRYKYSTLKERLPFFELKKFVGKAGYSWIEDTTVFHRGTIPNSGDRLMLSLCFYDKKSAAHFHNESHHPL